MRSIELKRSEARPQLFINIPFFTITSIMLCRAAIEAYNGGT